MDRLATTRPHPPSILVSTKRWLFRRPMGAVVVIRVANNSHHSSNHHHRRCSRAAASTARRHRQFRSSTTCNSRPHRKLVNNSHNNNHRRFMVVVPPLTIRVATSPARALHINRSHWPHRRRSNSRVALGRRQCLRLLVMRQVETRSRVDPVKQASVAQRTRMGTTIEAV